MTAETREKHRGHKTQKQDDEKIKAATILNNL